MTPPRILVAGIGNIFFGDDAFGIEVVRRLLARPQPDGVHIRDFGIRGLDLAYTLLDGAEFAILVDAMPRGGTPGGGARLCGGADLAIQPGHGGCGGR